MYLQNVRWEDMDWVSVTLDRDSSVALVNAVMNLRVS